jgi:hypothetical protein
LKDDAADFPKEYFIRGLLFHDVQELKVLSSKTMKAQKNEQKTNLKSHL